MLQFAPSALALAANRPIAPPISSTIAALDASAGGLHGSREILTGPNPALAIPNIWSRIPMRDILLRLAPLSPPASADPPWLVAAIMTPKNRIASAKNNHNWAWLTVPVRNDMATGYNGQVRLAIPRAPSLRVAGRSAPSDARRGRNGPRGSGRHRRS